MMIRRLAPLAAVLTLAACSPAEETAEPTGGPAPQTPPAETPAEPAPTPAGGEQGGGAAWKAAALPADQDRLARLPDAWRTALREADHEHGAVMDALGLLLVPDAALAGNLQPPPGAYRCRTVKVGSMDGAGLSYVAYPWFTCTVELTPGGDLVLTKTGGSQRTQGLLYPDTDRRLVFVGTQAWGAEEKDFPRYGANPERDQIGALERIGTSRWRLVLPWPRQESKLDVIELKK